MFYIFIHPAVYFIHPNSHFAASHLRKTALKQSTGSSWILLRFHQEFHQNWVTSITWVTLLCRKSTKTFWPETVSTASGFKNIASSTQFIRIHLRLIPFLLISLFSQETYKVDIYGWYSFHICMLNMYQILNIRNILVHRSNKLFNLERTLETIWSNLLILQTEKWKGRVAHCLFKVMWWEKWGEIQVSWSQGQDNFT